MHIHNSVDTNNNKLIMYVYKCKSTELVATQPSYALKGLQALVHFNSPVINPTFVNIFSTCSRVVMEVLLHI